MNTSRIPWWVWALGVGGIGFIVYRTWSSAGKAVGVATAATAQTIANVWLSLPVVGLGSGQQILGNAKLPDGTLVPLNSLIGQIRQDPNNTYAAIGGNLYQLSPSDPQGNYPAALLGPAPTGS